MKLPKQAKPVMRNVSTAKIEGGVGQSSACHDSCNTKTGFQKSLCLEMCDLN